MYQLLCLRANPYACMWQPVTQHPGAFQVRFVPAFIEWDGEAAGVSRPSSSLPNAGGGGGHLADAAASPSSASPAAGSPSAGGAFMEMWRRSRSALGSRSSSSGDIVGAHHEAGGPDEGSWHGGSREGSNGSSRRRENSEADYFNRVLFGG